MSEEEMSLKEFDLENKSDEPIEALFNHTQEIDFVKESPRHRVVIEMKAAGRFTNKDISQATGYTERSITTIIRQPWAQSLLVKLMRDKGETERETTYRMLNEMTIEAVERQREVLHLPLAGNVEAIRKVSNDILNRAFGTPTASVKITKTDETLDSLSDAEIVQRYQELKQRVGN